MLLRTNNDLVLLDNKKGLKVLIRKNMNYPTFIANILSRELLCELLNKKIERVNFSLSREDNNYREYLKYNNNHREHLKYNSINPLYYFNTFESLNKKQLLSCDLNVQDELAYFIKKEIDSKIVLIGNKVDMLTLYVKYNTIRKRRKNEKQQ